jgi:hypothetical protein
MGKTMFGIPGVKDKSQSGGAIAPRGTSAGNQGTGERSAGYKSQSGQQRESKQREFKPQEQKAPMATPAMTRPRSAVASGAQPHVTPRKKTEVSKTMFGMPAMNLPATPSDVPSPAEDESKGDVNVDRTTSKPANMSTSGEIEATQKGDVYGATMLGVPAVSDEMAHAAVARERQAARDADAAAITEMPDVAPPEEIPHASSGLAAGGTMIQPTVAPAASESESQSSETEAAVENAIAPSAQVDVDVQSGQVADVEISIPEQSTSITSSSAESRSGEISKSLVVGLIAGFLVLIGAIVFVAWKFLFS